MNPSRTFNDERECGDSFTARNLVCEFDTPTLTPTGKYGQWLWLSWQREGPQFESSHR